MNHKELLAKHALGILTPQEQELLREWMEEHPSNAALANKLKKRQDYRTLYRQYKRTHPKRQFHYLSWRNTFLKVACCMAPLLVITGLYLGLRSTPAPQIEMEPGMSKAILYVGTDTPIQLGEAKDINWFKMNKMNMVTDNKGTLTYRPSSTVQPLIEQQNRLQTPRGGEYRLVLTDGTKIHLNSSSSLSYPICFTDSAQRVVELSGEAYFEVAKDAKRPFIVKAGNIEVRQYGTSFSVTARPQRPMTVALEEGKIGITAFQQQEQLLQKGEVAICDNGKLLINKKDNLEAYTAWHHSRFVFDNATLGSIMETIAFWYDIDVQFQKAATEEIRFTGSVGRYENISLLLNAIEETSSVKFQREGNKKIIVMNK